MKSSSLNIYQDIPCPDSPNGRHDLRMMGIEQRNRIKCIHCNQAASTIKLNYQSMLESYCTFYSMVLTACGEVVS